MDDLLSNTIALASANCTPDPATELEFRSSGPSGGSGFGAQPGMGGPMFSDAFARKRSPGPYELLEAYKSIVYACLNLNANGVSRMPLRLYCTTGRDQKAPRFWECRTVTGKREKQYLKTRWGLPSTVRAASEINEVLDNPLLKTLECPNEFFDLQMLLRHLVISLDLIGAAYVEPIYDGFGVPRELWPLPSYLVYPVRGGGDTILQGYSYLGKLFKPEELIRWRYLSQRDPYLGQYSPVQAGYEYVGLHDDFISAQAAILEGGPRPDAVLSPRDAALGFGRDERRRIEMEVNRKFSGGRTGRMIVIDGALRLDTLSWDPQDLAGLEISEDAVNCIANCLDVPISKLRTKDVNRANADAGDYQHASQAIDPRCQLIASVFTHKVAKAIDPRYFFAFDNPVPEDLEAALKKRQTNLQIGFSCINQERADEGQEPVPWGDLPIMSTSVGPYDGTEPEPEVDDDDPGNPDPASDETPDPDEDEVDDDEKALLGTTLRVLERLEERMQADDRRSKRRRRRAQRLALERAARLAAGPAGVGDDGLPDCVPIDETFNAGTGWTGGSAGFFGVPEPTEGERGAGAGEAKHIPPPAGEADLEGATEVVPEAAPGDAGDDAELGGAAGELSQPDEL